MSLLERNSIFNQFKNKDGVLDGNKKLVLLAVVAGVTLFLGGGAALFSSSKMSQQGACLNTKIAVKPGDPKVTELRDKGYKNLGTEDGRVIFGTTDASNASICGNTNTIGISDKTLTGKGVEKEVRDLNQQALDNIELQRQNALKDTQLSQLKKRLKNNASNNPQKDTAKPKLAPKKVQTLHQKLVSGKKNK